MSGNYWWNKFVFSLWQKSVREADDWISGGKLFQGMDASTGNERQPTVARRYLPESAADVIRMSTDDDDQADQQQKLAYPLFSVLHRWCFAVHQILTDKYYQMSVYN